MMLRNTGRRRIPHTLAVVAWALLVAGVATPAAGAETAPSVHDLTPRGHVSDFAGVMPAEAARQLEAVLAALQQATGAEVAVVTVPSVPDGDVKTFAVELFQAWGLGQAGKDNGVLLLASIQDHRAEIEVGYGLEGLLPDAKVGRLLDAAVIPAFKQGDYSRGLVGGGLALAQVIAQDAGVTLRAGPRPEGPWRGGARHVTPLVHLVLLLIMILLVIHHPGLLFFLLGSGGGYGGRFGGGFGSGGFGGGGFGGFGGGASGGGGAGRSW